MEIAVIALLLAGGTLGGLVAFGRHALLAWYLREVRKVEIAQDPHDAIITYPLA